MLDRGVPQVADSLVFSKGAGVPLKPDTVSAAFNGLAGKAGLGDLPLKDLRHSRESLLSALGVHIKVIQDRLRHTTVTTTGDRYLRVLPGLQEAALRELEKALSGSRP